MKNVTQILTHTLLVMLASPMLVAQTDQQWAPGAYTEQGKR